MHIDNQTNCQELSSQTTIFIYFDEGLVRLTKHQRLPLKH